MAVDAHINVEGLDSLRAGLRKADAGLAKELGQAGKQAADIVARTAKPKVPVLTGRAQASLRAVVVNGGGGVRGGGPKAPHFGWLNFGGRVGRNKSVTRERVKPDRYVYTSLEEKRDEVVGAYVDGVNEVLRRAGLR